MTSDIEKYLKNLHNYDVLGKGGYGTVYKINNKIVIKVIINPNYEVCQDVKREFQILAYITSKSYCYVPRVYEFYSDEDTCAYTMEYVKGEDMYNWIEKNKPLEQYKMVNIARKILEAIVCLHNLGIYHMDLKLENIIINYTTRESEITIIDFGAACGTHIEKQNLRKKCSDEGTTPVYRSPDIAAKTGKGYEGNDVWTYGVIVYELCKSQATDLKSYKYYKTLKCDTDHCPIVLEKIVHLALNPDHSKRPSAQALLKEFKNK